MGWFPVDLDFDAAVLDVVDFHVQEGYGGILFFFMGELYISGAIYGVEVVSEGLSVSGLNFFQNVINIASPQGLQGQLRWPWPPGLP